LEDTLPRYPQPFHILSTYGQLKLAESVIDRSLPCENLHFDPSVSRILEGLLQMNVLIDSQHAQRGDELWCTTLFPGLNIAPILYDLMSMSRGTAEDAIQARRRECFRLAAIIYVIEIRQKFGLDPTPSLLYLTKLKTLLNSPGVLPTWGVSSGLLLWTLIVGASASCVMVPLRLECTRMLQECFKNAEMSDSYERFASTSNSMWSYAAMGPVLKLEQLSELLNHQQ
jgi:hypothetical protein